jgi:C-terminal processing protease CtpA/Prc
VLLINRITGSASDLFTCRLASTGRVLTNGSITHGNLTGQGVYILLPCNLVVRISHGYICDATGKIIEGNGTVPMITQEYSLKDIIESSDPVIDRAITELSSKIVVGGRQRN